MGDNSIMSDFAVVFSGLTSAMSIVKNLKGFEKQFDEASFKLQRAELYSQLADVKVEMADLQQSLISKDDEIRTLKEKLKVRGKMVYTDPYYQQKNSKGELEGQYCKVCYDGEDLLMRLEIMSSNSWKCGKCNNICVKDERWRH